MSESDDLRRLGDAEWDRGNKEMGARYHERARRAAAAEREREALKPWSAKFLPVFKRHGFDGNGIDFSGVKVEAIEAMANALVALEQSEEEDAAWLGGACGQPVCSSCLVDLPAFGPSLCAACVAKGVR